MTATLPLIVLAARVTLAEGPAPLRMMLLVHVLAGAVALVTGYFALYAAKGSALHRKSGIWFVYSIVTRPSSASLGSSRESRASPAVRSFARACRRARPTPSRRRCATRR